MSVTRHGKNQHKATCEKCGYSIEFDAHSYEDAKEHAFSLGWGGLPGNCFCPDCTGKICRGER